MVGDTSFLDAATSSPTASHPSDGSAKRVQTTRRVVFWRCVVAFMSITLVVIGIVISALQNSPVVCYPLPRVGNASEFCDNGFASLRAGGSCGADCNLGFRSAGQYHCGSDGSFLETPRCVEA
jgi:hypothetical protein